MTEDEMVGWHHLLNGHGFAQTLGFGDGQGGLVCCNSWGHKELDMTERLHWNMEKEMATHSSTLAWKIPWAEEHGRLLQSKG